MAYCEVDGLQPVRVTPEALAGFVEWLVENEQEIDARGIERHISAVLYATAVSGHAIELNTPVLWSALREAANRLAAKSMRARTRSLNPGRESVAGSICSRGNDHGSNESIA